MFVGVGFVDSYKATMDHYIRSVVWQVFKTSV